MAGLGYRFIALILLPALTLLAACGPATAPISTSPPIPGAATKTVTPPPPATFTPVSKPIVKRSATPTHQPVPIASPTPAPTSARALGADAAARYLIVKGPRVANVAALTLDMGSVGGSTLAVLDTLKANGIHATFFVTGKWAADNPSVLKAIVAGGHEVSNHSYSHPDFRRISREAMIEELSKTEEVVKRTAGISTHPFWRPPFGAYDDNVLRVVHDAGYKPVYWTLDGTDWRDESTVDTVVARVLKYAEPGSIIIMHGALKKTAEALPQIIPQLRARGLGLNTLSSLMNGP